MIVTLWQLIFSSGIIVLALAAMLLVAIANMWADHWTEVVLVFAGLIMYLFPDEWSSFDGYRAWRMDQWRFKPSNWLRFSGAVTVIVFSLVLFLD
jgi:hypothetical protein